jgi:hypothetical protein
MMSGVPLESCWAIKKLWNDEFYYKAASCWYFYWPIHISWLSSTWPSHYRQSLCKYGTKIMSLLTPWKSHYSEANRCWSTKRRPFMESRHLWQFIFKSTMLDGSAGSETRAKIPISTLSAESWQIETRIIIEVLSTQCKLLTIPITYFMYFNSLRLWTKHKLVGWFVQLCYSFLPEDGTWVSKRGSSYMC